MKINSALLSKVVRTIREQQLFQADDTLIVALSGGADSTALLDLLNRLPGFNPRLVVAHLNHCLRGSESDADEAFCRKLAEKYEVPYENRRVDVKYLAKSEGLNLEDAGRRARMNFLDLVREKHGAAAIVTAHHSDDQAETILMRLLRGSGMTGLCGIPYRNQRGYIRPLLNAAREEIVQYLQERGLDWREDASNLDTSFMRNRIRHELLPLLEQYNPAVRRTLISTAAILSDEDELLDALAEQAFSSLWSGHGSDYVCSIVEIKAYPIALRRRILRYACRRLAGNLDRFNLGHIESILQMLDSPRPNSRLSLPQSISAVREYDRLLLRLRTEGSLGDSGEVLIKAPGHYRLPDGGSLQVAISSTPLDFHDLSAGSACFNINKTPFPWRVRTFRPGDRMTPLGMTGRKKVKDIFIDKKVPLSERKCIPLVFCGDDLIWIAGVCISELCRIDNPAAATVMGTWEK